MRFLGAFIRVLGVILGALILVILAAFLWYKAYYFPTDRGVLQVRGPSAPVEICRDRLGVPSIEAETFEDAMFGLGFVLAQDRTIQLEIFRRAALGRLAEVLGEDFLEMDLFSRTMGFERIAERMWDGLPPDDQQVVQSYVDGINAGFRSLGWRIPLEMKLLGIEPEDWSPRVPMAFGMLIAWGLTDNYKNEYLALQMLERITAEQVMDLFLDPPEGPGPEVEVSGLPGRLWFIQAGDRLAGLVGAGAGCTGWAVGGDKTGQGCAMLIYDAHQGGPMIPTETYLVRLASADGFEAAGGVIVGLPGMFACRSRHMAWASYNAKVDVADLFVETIDPEDPDRYYHDGQWLDMEVLEEEICVKGRGCETHRVRSTVHGPIISHIIGEGDRALSVQWSVARLGRDFSGYWKLPASRSWDEFRGRLEHMDLPPQYFMYADRDGSIGVQLAGCVPVRPDGRPGIFPRDGTEPGRVWTDCAPLDELWRLHDPDAGHIAIANQRPPDWDGLHYLGGQHSSIRRFQRIDQLLSDMDRVDETAMIALRTDTHTLVGEELAPVFVRDLEGADDPGLEWVRAELQGWDFKLEADSRAGAVFETMFHALGYETFADELGDELAVEYMNITGQFTDRLAAMIHEPDNPWFDDVNAPGRQTRTEMVRRAAARALDELAERLGPDRDRWRWGDLHRITFKHYSDGLVPFFNRGPYPWPGSGQTVERGGYSYGNRFQVHNHAHYRMAANLCRDDHVKALITTGQSAWLFHPNFDDMIKRWLGDELVEIPLDPDADEAGCSRRLVLEPQ